MVAGKTYALSLCLSGSRSDEILDGLISTGLFDSLPSELLIDNEEVPAPPRWKQKLASSKVEAAAIWEEDDDIKKIVVAPRPGTVTAVVPKAFATREEAVAIIEALPFTLCTIGTVGQKPVTTDSERFRGHLVALGWGCAFRGEGHDRLVSRRWLEFGPWELIRRPNDLSIVLFHELTSNMTAAKKQAAPGHVRMAGWDAGGMLGDQPEPIKGGIYRAKQHRYEIIVDKGREVSEEEMNNARSAQANRRTGKERIDHMAFVFIEQSDAEKHLHEMWLRDLEVWYVEEEGNHRIDDDYNPKPRPPAWANGK